MSWEPVEAFPGEKRGGGGAFRGQAMPVVAQRGAPTLRERLELFWRSTPELAYRRSAKRVVLTPGHLYVERLDGDRSRVARSAVRGRRLDRGRVVYGVIDGEDLALLPRDGCDVVAALEGQLRGEEEPTGSVVKSQGRAVSIGVALVAWPVAFVLLQEASWAQVLDRVAHGASYTSETALTFYAAIGLLLFGLFILVVGPVRTRIDPVGVHRVRGIFPWLHTIEAPEDFRKVVITPMHGAKGRRELAGVAVRLIRHDGWKALVLERFHVRSQSTEAMRDAAGSYARRVADLLDIELDTVGLPPERKEAR